MKSNVVIVGGGITGILCALRLSKEKKSSADSEIILIDEHQTLGGRFFFSNSPHKSGFGFENEAPSSLETLKRHLYLYLSEDEKNYLENWIQEKAKIHAFSKIVPKRYFVKKETPLNAEYILLSNSEFLTKKDAEILQQIAQIQKNALFEQEKDKPFEQSLLWKNIHKNIQENIRPVLECILGKYALLFSVKSLGENLKNFFYEPQIYHDSFFLRTTEIELAFAQLLEKRGVKIYTECMLKSVGESDFLYDLCVVHKNISHIQCEKIIFTIPPYQLRMLIQSEHLSPQLSRFLSKVQPVSLVNLEINDFKNKCSEQFENKFKIYDHLYFPVEGVQGFVTSDDRFICAVELDYETSLQAPAVRESITFLRRALKRILKPEFSEELKKGSFIRKTEMFEKIVLHPVAFNIPHQTQTEHLQELNDVCLGLKNVFIAGDYFYSFGDENWKRIIKSVEIVVQHILQ